LRTVYFIFGIWWRHLVLCLLGMRLVSCIGRADEPNRHLPGIRATTPRTTQKRKVVVALNVVWIE